MQSSDADNPTPSDDELVAAATAGDRAALEALIGRYQRWIYNVALRMVWDPEDARDVTQEVIVKVITNLATFRREASFKTWLGRITANHVIKMKQRKSETSVTTFSAYGDDLAGIPDLDPPDPREVPADVRLIVEEAKIGCMHGMLLCLDREQRFVYILGELFGVTDVVGAEILELTPANFRQRLSRARRDLYNFMNDRCGLLRETNPCRCARKTKSFMKLGLIDPSRLQFAADHVRRVRDVAPSRSRELDKLDEQYADLFRDTPFAERADLVDVVKQALAAPDVLDLFDLG